MANCRPLKIACLGCGARQTYAQLATRRPDRFEIVAGADPVAQRVEKMSRISGRADFRRFAGGHELLAAGKIADLMIVATQDNDHYEHCRARCGPATTCCWKNRSPRTPRRCWKSSAWPPSPGAA